MSLRRLGKTPDKMVDRTNSNIELTEQTNGRSRSLSRHETHSHLHTDTPFDNYERAISVLNYKGPDRVIFDTLNYSDLVEMKGKKEGTCSLNWCIMMPHSNIRIFWHFVVLFLLLYTAIVMPVNVAFVNRNSTDFDYVVDFLFLVDIFVSFVSAYEMESGAIVTDPKRIAIHYLKSWFVLDCVTTFPFHLFLTRGSLPRIFRTWKLTKLVRLARILKVMRVHRVETMMNYVQYAPRFHPSLLRMTKLFFKALIFCHVSGCIWYIVGDYQGDDGRTSWIEAKGLPNLQLKNSTSSDAFKLYLFSLYWAVETLTTVGYGDIVANNEYEIFWSIVMMLCGTMFFAYITGAIASVIMTNDEADIQFRFKMASLAHFWERAKINPDLQRKMGIFLAKKWRQLHSSHRFMRWDEILNDCSHELRHTVILEMYSDILETQSFQILSDYPRYLDALAMAFRPVTYPPGYCISQKGSFTTDWYVISQGRICFRRTTKKASFAVFQEGWFKKSTTLKTMEQKTRRHYGRLFQDRIRYYKDEKTSKHIGEIFLDNCNISIPENEIRSCCPGEHTPVLNEIQFESTCDVCEKTMDSGQMHECNDGCNWRCCNTCWKTTEYPLYIIPMSGTKEKVFRNKLVFQRFKERDEWMYKISDVTALLKEENIAHRSIKSSLNEKKSKFEKKTFGNRIMSKKKPILFTQINRLTILLIEDVHLEEKHFQLKLRFPSSTFAQTGDWLGIYEVHKHDTHLLPPARRKYTVLSEKECTMKWEIQNLGLKPAMLYNIRYFRKGGKKPLARSSAFSVRRGKKNVSLSAEMGVGTSVGTIGILLSSIWLFDSFCTSPCRLYTITSNRYLEILEKMEENNESRIVPSLVFQMMLEKLKKLQSLHLIEENNFTDTSFTTIKNQKVKMDAQKDKILKWLASRKNTSNASAFFSTNKHKYDVRTSYSQSYSRSSICTTPVSRSHADIAEKKMIKRDTTSTLSNNIISKKLAQLLQRTKTVTKKFEELQRVTNLKASEIELKTDS